MFLRIKNDVVVTDFGIYEELRMELRNKFHLLRIGTIKKRLNKVVKLFEM